MASAPATGPSPAMGMKMAMASTISGKARMALRTWRTSVETGPLETFFAPKKPRGSETTAPMTVPTQAISSDSTMAVHGDGQVVEVGAALQEHLAEDGPHADRQLEDVGQVDVEAHRAPGHDDRHGAPAGALRRAVEGRIGRTASGAAATLTPASDAGGWRPAR